MDSLVCLLGVLNEKKMNLELIEVLSSIEKLLGLDHLYPDEFACENSMIFGLDNAQGFAQLEEIIVMDNNPNDDICQKVNDILD